MIVEYYDGAMQTVETKEDFQIASNFIAYNDLGEGATEFERYDAVMAAIEGNGNRLSNTQALSLLAEVGGRAGDTDRLQWSALYNLTTGETKLFAHRNTENIISSRLILSK